MITGFDAPARGGRIRSVEDRNGNVIRFTYRSDRIEALDTLGRRIDVTLAKGRIHEVRDHAGRTWNYGYDGDDRLIEVIQPVTRNDPAGTILRYGYDDAHRLRSITDAKGQTWLVVRYDDAGRVVEQTHGTGTYTFAYESIGQGLSAGVRVTCGLKNGGTLVVDHDSAGHPVSRMLFVCRTAFAPVTVQPVAGDGPDHPTTITLNLEAAYAFNSRGQLLSKTHIDGAVTTFEYYPVADPTGRGGPGTATADPGAICGYLAKVTRDASGSRHQTGYRWDAYGNLVEVIDGRRNAVRLRYDALGRLERVDGRGLAGDWIEYRYDANGNESESIQPFERLEVDEASGKLVTRTGTIRELRSYDVLDQLVARTIVGGDARVTERFVRDADERIVRLIQPTGAVTEVEYDERDLPIASTRAAGTKEAVTERRFYTANGDLRSEIDGRGGTTRYHYDGFGRHVGVTDRLGASWTRSLDEAGNAVRLAVEAGDGEAVDEGEGVGRNGGCRTRAASRMRRPLIETAVRYDEWGRPVRIDQALRDPAGRALGASGWDGQEGVSSTLVEYIANGRPGRVWNEAGNIVTVTYDGLGQVASISDLTGEQAEFTYDANGNSTALSYRAPAIDRDDPRSTVRMRYDEMDRLVARQVDDDAPESFAYDALGGVNGHRRDSGLHLRLLHDGLGRRIGQFLIVGDGGDGPAARILRRFEYDDAYRLTAHTDGAGNRTIYRYDALDRQVGIVYPDGAEAIAEYDANGNVVRTVDPRGTEITLRYDQGDRLVERRSRLAGSDATELESFEYDAIGRLVRATTPTGELQRTYDSLSRVLTESQAGRAQTIEYEYDALGRLVRKTVTDRAGNVTVIEFVWSGSTLIEEYENGVLVRTYVYCLGTSPARLTVDRGGRSDYWYVHNGRGLAAGLVRATDPNAFAERYGYEITGFPFMKEIDGLKVNLPERVGTASSLWNSVLAGDSFGALSRDWANGTISGSGGRHLDPLIAAALNTSATIAGGVHNTLKMTVGKQFESFLAMLGLGGRSNGFISRGGAGGQGAKDKSQGKTSSGGGASKGFGGRPQSAVGPSPMARDFSLYAAGDGGTSLFPSSGQNPAFDFSKGGGGSSGTSGASGGTSTGGLIGQINAFMDTPGGQVVTGLLSGVATGVQSSITGGPPKGDPPPGSPSSSGSGEGKKQQSQEQEQARREREEKERKEREQKEKEQKEKEQKEKEQKEKEQKEKEQKGQGKDAKDAKEEEEADKKKKSGSTYVDPDQQFQTAIVTPEQIEMRLNGPKRPVNPNGGGGWEIDTSSPPKIHGGSDPTLERYDGETFGGLTLTSGEPKFPIAPIRYVRDYEPPQPTFPPNGGGENERDTGVP